MPSSLERLISNAERITAEKHNMGDILYGDEIGVFSEGYEARLDIGTDCMKKAVPADHESWATRLRITRLDGPSVGPVRDDHLVGIFSENNCVRLDVGSDSMKKAADPGHLSWATRLKIIPIAGEKTDTVMYGDLVAFLSEDRRCRLDLGADAVPRPASSSHRSWATRLRIQGADPIVECIAVSSMDYDLANSRITGSRTESLYSVTIPNSSTSVQTMNLGETHAVSETAEWTNKIGFKVGTTAKAKTSIPFVAEGTVEVSAEASYEHGWGGSETRTRQWTWNVTASVEPQSTLKVLVVVACSKLEVPYRMTGDFRRLSGQYTRDTISGLFSGENSHDLKVTYKTIDEGGNEIRTAEKTLIKGVGT